NVALNATLTAGAGNITLSGAATGDLVITADQTSAGVMSISATRDLIIAATIQTTGVGAGISLSADSDNDGVGGVWLQTAALVSATGTLTVQGSDLFATSTSVDSVRIDDDGGNAQAQAGGAVQLLGKAAAPASADLFVAGIVRNTSGNITLDRKTH